MAAREDFCRGKESEASDRRRRDSRHLATSWLKPGIDAAVLDRVDGIGQPDQLVRGGIGVAEETRLGEPRSCLSLLTLAHRLFPPEANGIRPFLGFG